MSRVTRLRVPLQCAFAAAAVAVFTLSGCASMYVDNGMPDVPASAYVRPPTPQPVQMLFTFKTKGTANTKATELLKKNATDAVMASGLFASVGSAPTPGGTLLSVTIDNVPVTSEKDAMAKGFTTGLTFGLAGSQVTDGYVCTVDYIASPSAAKITKVVHHAIHTNIGAHSAPANSTKAASAMAAIKTVVNQAIGNALKELSADPGFGH